MGEIKMFAGNFAPRGWVSCSGQLLPISEYESLFTLIGTTYGGDGMNTFALPNLQGRCPMHKGEGDEMGATGSIDLSETDRINNSAPKYLAPGCVALSFIIALEGIYPSAERERGGGTEPFLAEGRLFAFNFAPYGWVQCNGQLLPINQNQALFSLLGTTYGGNGQTTFALPDLRHSVSMHTPTQWGESVKGERPRAPGKTDIEFLVLNSCIALMGIFPSQN